MPLDFNKIYVIESLEAPETFTGTNLYDNVLQHFNTKYADKDAELINVNTKDELIAAFEKIENECKNGIKPIIHLEIHGLDDRTGLALNRGYIEWEELYGQLSKINAASNWHLYLTMAVCFGNYAMKLIRPNLPAPFAGILGSFDALSIYGLEISYDAFYQELLNSLDLDAAIIALQTANPSLEEYKLIKAEQTFKNVMQKYFDTQFSHSVVTSRFNKSTRELGIKQSRDRNEWTRARTTFHATLVREKQRTLEEFKTIFFMYDLFPDNKTTLCVGWQPSDN